MGKLAYLSALDEGKALTVKKRLLIRARRSRLNNDDKTYIFHDEFLVLLRGGAEIRRENILEGRTEFLLFWQNTQFVHVCFDDVECIYYTVR